MPSSQKISQIPNQDNLAYAELFGGGKSKKIENLLTISDDDQKSLLESIKLFAQINTIDLNKKFSLVKEFIKDKQQANKLLKSFKYLYHDRLKSKVTGRETIAKDFVALQGEFKDIANKLKKIEQAQELLSRGYSPKLILENLFIALWALAY